MGYKYFQKTKDLKSLLSGLDQSKTLDDVSLKEVNERILPGEL